MITKPRYITAGVREMLPASLQHILWYVIETMKVPEKDYLQIFELAPCRNNGKHQLRILHRQEEPAYQKEYFINTKQHINRKIYVIDDGTHCTMLLADEY